MAHEPSGPAKKKGDEEPRSGRAVARSVSHPRPASNSSLMMVQQDQYGRMGIETHRGVYPSPRTMEAYDKINPRINESLIEAFEEEGRERRWRARVLTNATIFQGKLGMVFALIVAIFFGYLSYLLIKGGHDLAGTFLGTGDLVSLVTVFIIGGIRKTPRDPADDDTADE